MPVTHPHLHPEPGADPVTVTRVRRRHATLVAAAVSVLVIDAATKIAASEWLVGRGAVELPGPVDLRLGYNPGVAFGLGNTLPASVVLVFTAIVTLAIAVAAWRGFFASSLAAGVVVGGATANVVDRAHGGTVVDMLYTGWWPTFNVADVAIVCGAIALVVLSWRTAAEEPDTE